MMSPSSSLLCVCGVAHECNSIIFLQEKLEEKLTGKLTAERPKKCPFVVLSACQTASKNPPRAGIGAQEAPNAHRDAQQTHEVNADRTSATKALSLRVLCVAIRAHWRIWQFCGPKSAMGMRRITSSWCGAAEPAGLPVRSTSVQKQ